MPLPLSHNRSAHSVGLPTVLIFFLSVKSRFAVVLSATISATSSSDTSLRSHSATCILFCVNVPVLSVQITEVAPIVSQECIVRGNVFSFISLRILNAKLKVTDIGSPSGTATTISVTAIIIVLRTYVMKLIQPSPDEKLASPM